MNAPLLIRLLGPTDACVLDCVAPGVFDHPIDPRWTAEFFADPRHHLVVALLGGQVVGMASAVHYVHPDKPPELWVNEVGVAPTHQRQGIGKQLLRALLAHGRSLGCSEAWLGTEPTNVAARRLYAAVCGQEQPMVYVTFQLPAEIAPAHMTPPAFSLQPTLHGPTLTLRPLQPDDFEELYQAASDPLVWAQHPQPLRYQRPVFEAYFNDALASRSALAVVDRQTGAVIGNSRYYDYNEAERELAIGFTFLARSHWGGATNAELKQLMLDYAFQWATTVWFHVGPENTRSRKALEKIGARYSHLGTKTLPDRTEEVAFYRIDRLA